MVLDSAFADLTMLAEEMVIIRIRFKIKIWIEIVVKIISFRI